MRPPLRRFARKLFVVLALAVVAAWLVPSFVSAERYRRRLQAGLEQALKRPVAFGAIAFRLIPHPGFSIQNAVVRDDPVFGSEPFARVEKIDCEVRWRSLWRSHLEFARLYLDHPTFNVVRNTRGQWNVGRLLFESGIASPVVPQGRPSRGAGNLNLEVEGARVNFKVGENKKPFALTDLGGRLDFQASRGLVEYSLSGSPVRTDLSLASRGPLSPGPLEIEGKWTPGKDLQGPIDATLRTRRSSLYDWVPLLTSHNPEIYGVLNASVHLTGSLHALEIEGDGDLSELHRWELTPPSGLAPFRLHFRGELDRPRGRVLVQNLDVSFADSHVHLAGSVEHIPASPELNLLLGLDRSRLEDLVALRRRFWGNQAALGASGRVDGLVAIQGPWTELRYGGFVIGREVRLSTPSRRFPVTEVVLRIDAQGARLAPVRITLAPRVELVAEGTLDYAPGGAPPPPPQTARLASGGARRRHKAQLAHRLAERRLTSTETTRKGFAAPRCELTFSARALPLADVLRFGRASGLRAIQGLEAEEGTASGTFRLAWKGWPMAPPLLEGRLELDRARLLVPGLTEPLRIPRASIQTSGSRIVAFPLLAAIGGSTFNFRLEHEGESKRPWKFEARTDRLSLEEGAKWFEALGHGKPSSIFDRLPGLSSLGARRTAASNLFSSLEAKGVLITSALTYRSLSLESFRATVEISNRVVRVSDATFRAAGGRGQGKVDADLATQPARLTGEVALEEAGLQNLTARLPAALGGIRGWLSGSGRFEARGLTREEVSASLRGEAMVKLKAISFGDFDPLEALAREGGLGTLERARKGAQLRFATLALQARDRCVLLAKTPIDLAGAKLELSGNYAFRGTLDLSVRADFRHVARRWQGQVPDAIGPSPVAAGPGQTGEGRQNPVDLHLAGPLDKLAIVPAVEISRSNSSRN